MLTSTRINPSDCAMPDMTAEAMTVATKAFADSTGAFTAGIWRSKPNRIQVNYTKNEFCYLIEGEVHLTPVDGETAIYRAGDAFVVPAGFKGAWVMPVAVAKYYVLHVPQVD